MSILHSKIKQQAEGQLHNEKIFLARYFHHKKGQKMVRDQKVKVIYIAAWSRSGSTILANVLGQLDGFFSVGELSYIWDRGLKQNRLCGCGVPFNDCSEWRSIMELAFGSDNRIDEEEMVRIRESIIRARSMPFMIIPRGDQLLKQRAGEYLYALEKLYLAIQRHSNCRVIVDSSKYPMYGYLLKMVPSIDLYVIHLVRDPRATAYSWQRKKIRPDVARLDYLPQIGSTENSIKWNVWNTACEMLGKTGLRKYSMIRYEDFIKEPKKVVAALCALLDEKGSLDNTPFIDDHSVRLEATHSVSGNPNRMMTGSVRLESDVEWHSKLSTKDKVLTASLTWPLMMKYGYSGFSGK